VVWEFLSCSEEVPPGLINLISGCLPPGLLRENLMTLDIIFPIIGDNASRGILEQGVRKHMLDKYLLDRFELDSQDHYEGPEDTLDPRDVRSLYTKYPYWANRLYDLWREAGDPTPITRIERWSEARRNPWFTYWCAVVSIILVAIFGILAIGLGAVQVWILWCDGWIIHRYLSVSISRVAARSSDIICP
jgi:hypothetical protein